MIELLPESEAARETWQAVIDLARRRPSGWALIGAQMVVLHGLEKGRVLPRLTVDADLLVDVRLVASGVHEVSSDLVDAGFEISDPDPFGVAHRFRRAKAVSRPTPPHRDRLRCTMRLLEARHGRRSSRRARP